MTESCRFKGQLRQKTIGQPEITAPSPLRARLREDFLEKQEINLYVCNNTERAITSFGNVFFQQKRDYHDLER